MTWRIPFAYAQVEMNESLSPGNMYMSMDVSSLVWRDSIDQSEMNIRQKQINLFIFTSHQIRF